MDLHEFKAKRLLAGYGIASPEGRVAVTADEAASAAKELGGAVYVKAQIHAGDRAQAGGVKKAESPAEARKAAHQLLGQKLVTPQTGPAGHAVKRVLIESAVRAQKEIYLSMMIDALDASIVVLGGKGGTGVEDRAAAGAKLESLHLGLNGEGKSGDIAEFCKRLGATGAEAEKLAATVKNMHRAFVELDASLIEINPLVFNEKGEPVALDAKIVLDDNALFRHPDLAGLREEDEIDEIELKAQQHQINFMQMGGNIGVVVNGAGLGLATLDMLRAAGGEPANFMDIRTTAKSLDIAQGVGLVLDNPKVKVILVNVYGGGMQPCDTIIEGLGIAFRRKGRVLPLVLRVTGNNEDIARVRMESFGLPKTLSPDMWQAATRAVAIAQGKAR
ncbi:MAG TPA: ATP-grasp domain-containing protein [Xanthobacteraceae bacterium]|nr:ATP-grasp domain-containing protein [Xanthobacteraceae bacterium]